MDLFRLPIVFEDPFAPPKDQNPAASGGSSTIDHSHDAPDETYKCGKEVVRLDIGKYVGAGLLGNRSIPSLSTTKPENPVVGPQTSVMKNSNWIFWFQHGQKACPFVPSHGHSHPPMINFVTGSNGSISMD